MAKKRNIKFVGHACGPRISTVAGTEVPIIEQGLDLNVLMVASLARTNDPRGFDHKRKPWSVLEWGGATGGELGEAQNIAKKILRLRQGTRGNKKKDRNEAKLVKKLGREMADTICYLAAWAGTEGIDLSAAVVEAFNKKSTEIGYDFKL